MAASDEVRECRELSITKNEAKLLEVLEAFHKSAACPSKGHLRVAGGWVRDKLMGTNSNDWDLVIEDCTGKVYADAFQRWLNEEGIVRKLSCKIIPANPDKSKHLETAMLTLLDFNTSLDFVNLRSEKYSATSRVPVMEFGTPLQDAERRDFTINALFYNITTHEVEDFTGYGLADLEARVLRTPLDATKTFLDDPLRLIRALRFLAKLPDFTAHEGIRMAAGAPEVVAALKTKVSVDRVRAELAKTMEYGERASQAFKYMKEWNLISVIFDDLSPVDFPKRRRKSYELPLPKTEEQGPYSFGLALLEFMSHLMSTVRSQGLTDIVPLTQSSFWDEGKFHNIDNIGAILFTCLLVASFGSELPDPEKKGVISQAELVLVNLRCRGVAQVVVVFYGCFEALFQVLEKGSHITREEAGVLLRTKGLARWFDLSLLLAAAFQVLLGKFSQGETEAVGNTPSAEEQVCNVVRQTRSLITDSLKLHEVWSLTPLITGKELPQVLPRIPPGVAFRDVMNFQTEWMIHEWQNGVSRARADDLRNALQTRFPLYA